MMAVLRYKHDKVSENGFSLIEMLVTMVIAMVILAGLLFTFTHQYSEYKYQNKRVDAVQDLEFVINFIADDLRSALAVGGTVAIAISDTGSDPNKYTNQVNISAWEEDLTYWADAAERDTNNYIAIRRYDYDKANESLRYDRNTIPAVGLSEILSNVTDFRVFQDIPGAQPILTGTTPFPGSPFGLQNLTILDSNGNPVTVHGYTVLIEIAVDAGYKEGSFINARGVDVRTFESPARKRVWRYLQVHPRSSVD